MRDLIFESSREVPCVRRCDVMVCGGGPAGVAAALAAAQDGASVQLVELHGALGGVWTSGLLSYVLDANRRGGVLEQITDRVEALDGRPLHRLESDLPWVQGSFFYSAETMKVALDSLCEDAGVSVRLHTRVAAAITEDGELRHVITESKSGREAWNAGVFIDATGDGDLAALAGCDYDLGRPGTGALQPMTLMAIVTGIDPAEGREMAFEKNGLPRALGREFAELGIHPSYGKPTLFPVGEGLFALMANHEYGGSALDADTLSAASRSARAEVFQIVKSLRKSGGVWRNLELVATAAQIGVREGRRILGLANVTAADLIHGTRYSDSACHVTFPVDIHATQPDADRGYGNDGVVAQPYDIPFGALVARDVDRLLMAGRCISGDFVAHASYRVTGNAVVMGESAGRAAAWCVREGVAPHAAWRNEAFIQSFSK